MSIIMIWNIVDLEEEHLMRYCMNNRHKSVPITTESIWADVLSEIMLRTQAFIHACKQTA